MTYHDVFTHCTDTATLVAELQATHPDRINVMDSDNPEFIVDKAPMTVRNGNETMCRLYVNDDDLAMIQGLDSVTVLGTWEEVNADTALRAIYDRVYDQTPVQIDDDNGGTITYTPHEQFTVFAQ